MAKAKTTKDKNSVPAPDSDWQAESDLRTLIEAEKIKLDESRLKAAMTKKREMEKSLSKVGK